MVIIYNSKKQKQPKHIDTLPPATEQKDKVLEALKNRLEEALSEHQETQQRNMELEKEKDELLKLIKDYEISLETVTSKLRTYANTTLEEQSQLRQEYSAVLEAEKETTITLFMENVMLQSQLSQLAKNLKVEYETTSVDNYYGERIARLEQEKRNLLEISRLSAKKK
ncbi:hypothetical protein G6F62_001136 [Rhizopus arrhizus]|nr:hypothetical protein G6F23_008966 [Rhizopus arrhizus]KAG1357962.1 hypothetical protein G6F62_001136 [Rhizopus arrhizus]